MVCAAPEVLYPHPLRYIGFKLFFAYSKSEKISSHTASGSASLLDPVHHVSSVLRGTFSKNLTKIEIGSPLKKTGLTYNLLLHARRGEVEVFHVHQYGIGPVHHYIELRPF
jgi:hypothetical protein